MKALSSRGVVHKKRGEHKEPKHAQHVIHPPSTPELVVVGNDLAPPRSLAMRRNALSEGNSGPPGNLQGKLTIRHA
jgi:hypothetical protein